MSVDVRFVANYLLGICWFMYTLIIKYRITAKMAKTGEKILLDYRTSLT